MYRKYLTNEKLSLRLFWFIFVLYTLVYTTKNCYSSAMSVIVHEGVMTKSQTGFISSMFYLVYAPLQVVGGKLADKYNPHKIIVISLLGSAVVNFAIFLNQNYVFMLTMWILNAVAQFGVWPAVFKIVSSQLAREHRAKSVFYITFASSVGLIFAYAAAMFMEKWQYNFLFSAVVLLVLAVLTYLIYLYMDKRMEEYEPVQQQTVSKTEEKETVSSRALFLRSGLYIMLPIVVIRTVIQNSQSVSPTLLMESYGAVSPVIGNFLSLFIIAAGILGTVISKHLYYRYLRNEVKGYIFGFIILVPILLAVTFVGKLPIVLVVVSLAAVSFLSSGTALFNSFMSMRFVKYGKNGEAAGIINSAASIGFVIQTYGIAFIADRFGWITVTWLWVGIAVLALVLLAINYPRWKRFIEE